MVLTMAAVADHKGFQAGALRVEVEQRTVGEGRAAQACFHSTIHLDESLPPRVRRMLFNAARTCEIHKMLHQPVLFEEDPTP
jgi:hypothetical protein